MSRPLKGFSSTKRAQVRTPEQIRADNDRWERRRAERTMQLYPVTTPSELSDERADEGADLNTSYGNSANVTRDDLVRQGVVAPDETYPRYFINQWQQRVVQYEADGAIYTDPHSLISRRPTSKRPQQRVANHVSYNILGED